MLERQDLKLPPHSLEAEQAVLGAVALDAKAWERIADRLSVDDFYRPEHKLLFKAMERMAKMNQPIDALTLTEHLRAHQELESVGGEVYIFELIRHTPGSANVQSYADLVRERSVLRRLVDVGQRIADSAFRPEGMSPEDLIDQAEREVFSIAHQSVRGAGPKPVHLLLKNTVERIDQLYHDPSMMTGLPTGYRDFDEMTSGLQRSDLIVVAGRPSMGKTAFAMNVVEHVALKTQKPVLIFSMEMPGEALVLRMISSLGRIDQQRLRSGKLSDEDWPRISSAISLLAEVPMFFDDTPALSPTELRARARRLAREQGELGLIMVDYLQLMQVPGSKEHRTAEISEISRSLKTLAKELNVPVIALSQLNRSLEQRTDRRPMMSDLRESGAIEQDADLIVFIYRDEVYHEDSRDKGTAEIIIAKQRNGPTGKVRLTFLGQYTRFENYLPSTRDVLVPI